MDGLRIAMLGSLAIHRGASAPMGLPSTTQRRLLTALALESGRALPAPRLCELLECSPGSLRTSMSRLRDRLGHDHVRTIPPGYALMATTDIGEFAALVTEADTATPGDAVDLLDRALALWRGEAIEEFRGEFWAIPEVARLDELRAAATEARAEAMVATQRSAQAIADLSAHCALHPLRERPRITLMRALADEGRSTEALRVFQEFRRHLAESTGTEPSAEIRAVEQAIVVGSGEAEPNESPTPVAPMAFLFTSSSGSHRSALRRHEPSDDDDDDDDEGGHGFDPTGRLQAAITAHHGVVIDTAMGAPAAAFDSAQDAVAAAVAAQHALATAAALAAGAAQHSTCDVAIGIHFGLAVRRDDRWYGPTLDEAGRIADVAHGGQIVVSQVVAALVDAEMTDLGEHRLRDLRDKRRLFQIDAGGGPQRFPPLRSVGTFRTTLPAQRTTFIGRTTLTAQLRRLIDEHRLVSLIGPGGVGKTRLAIETAGQALGRFAGGVFFADLTQATSPEEVPRTLLRALKAPARLTELDDATIDELLADREALVVIDNCEHVIDRAAELIDDLLVRAPGIRILATSREPLQLHGERRLVVPSLDVDGPASASARLFVDRAAAADETAHHDDLDLASIEQIVRRLDGIPLAIEIAAARCATLGAPGILERLDDRFTLLEQSLRRIPQRHQTLSATIDWSFDLLVPEQQRAFLRLSACAGAFSGRTAARLLERSDAEGLQLLEALRAKSLLRVVRDGDDPAYGLLETLREYGRAKAASTGEADHAQLALERALLPPDAFLDDWARLVNHYICAADPAMVIEDTTRVAAATVAMEHGRIEHAAFIFGSVAYREDPGALRARAEIVASIAEQRQALSPMGWLVANATTLLLQRDARDYLAVIETSARIVADVGHDHEAGSWFELWRCALVTAVDPEGGLAEVDAALPAAYDRARPPVDWTLSQFLSTKAAGLALLGRLDEAAPSAVESAGCATAGQESRDQSLAMQAWISYLRGAAVSPELTDAIAGQDFELGLAELCAAPGALHAGGSVEERAARLVALARARPKLDLATPYLLAFSWLAIEEGDVRRARRLVDHAEMFDASTQVALLYALAALEGWTAEAWHAGRDAMCAKYLSPDHEPAVRMGIEVLDAELDDWERRLSPEVIDLRHRGDGALAAAGEAEL
jgi:predicted ATPase/DNA-binding SARP family transcriptional activator